MNKIITLIMCVAFSTTMTGQTVKVEGGVKTIEGDVKALKGQVETLNGQMASMQSRLNELADRNAEYKKALDIKQTLNATDADGYQYGFVSAIGDANTGKLTITINMFNPGPTRKKQMSSAYFTDYNGTGRQTYDFVFGNNESLSTTIDSNTNMKLYVNFEQVPVSIKRIASLTINTNLSTSLLSYTTVNFRDLPVEWK